MVTESAALTIAMEADGAIRAALIDAITGEVVAERGVLMTEFSESLVPALCQEIRRLETLAAAHSDGKFRHGALRDVVFRFMNRYYILRPLPSADGQTSHFLQLDLDRGAANIPAAQASLAEAAALLAGTLKPSPPSRSETASHDLASEVSSPSGFTESRPPDAGPPLSPPSFLFDQDLLRLLDPTAP